MSRFSALRRAAVAREPPVARQILVLQVLVVLLVVAVAVGLAAYDARRDARETATAGALTVARSVADAPDVTRALEGEDPSAVLQPFAERVRDDVGVDFVVVMRLDRIRLTHPDPERIGERFIGDVGDAPDGGIFTQEYAGTLGPSVRAVVPVLDDGEVVALVAAGITVARIDRELRADLLVVLAAAGVVALGGLVGAVWVGRRLRRKTHGLGETEITRMFEYYNAVLHAVREGLLLLDTDGRVTLANDEARRLLDLPEPVAGRPLASLGIAPGLVTAAGSGQTEADDIYVSGDRVLVVSTSPAHWEGRLVGSVVSLRDHTELRAVTGELDLARSMAEMLRSQSHEAANRLHTVVSLIELGRPDEAVDFATAELRVAQRLTDQVVGAVGDPVLAALLLGKTAEAAEAGVELTLSGELPADRVPVEPRDLVTVVGNLVDNALDAVAGHEAGRIDVAIEVDEAALHIVVGDNGPGLAPEDAARVLERGWTTKASLDGPGRGVGLALVGQVAARHGGEVGIGRSALGGARFEVTLRLPTGPTRVDAQP